MEKPFFRFEQKAGDPIQVGERKIIPFAQSLTIRAPFGWPGGLIWNRPASVLVVHPGGQEQVLPVHDVTRLVQLSLLGAGIASSLLMWSLFRITRKSKKGVNSDEQ